MKTAKEMFEELDFSVGFLNNYRGKIELQRDGTNNLVYTIKGLIPNHSDMVIGYIVFDKELTKVFVKNEKGGKIGSYTIKTYSTDMRKDFREPTKIQMIELGWLDE